MNDLLRVGFFVWILSIQMASGKCPPSSTRIYLTSVNECKSAEPKTIFRLIFSTRLDSAKHSCEFIMNSPENKCH